MSGGSWWLHNCPPIDWCLRHWTECQLLLFFSTVLTAFCDADAEAHLAIAGEGGVVEQEVGTEEEDDCVKHTQARPVQEDGPTEEGVLRNVPETRGEEANLLEGRK